MALVRRALCVSACALIIAPLEPVAVAQTNPPRPPSPASPPISSGFEVGFRAAYGLPFGSRVEGESLDATVQWALPFAIDAGYRFDPHLYVGLLLGYSRLGLDETTLRCNTQPVDGPGDCVGSMSRVTVEAQYRFFPEARLAPWVGAGFGYEWFTVDYASGGMMPGPVGVTDRGTELGHLELGGDVRLLPALVVGPFVSGSIGRYGSHVVSRTTGSSVSDIGDKAIHGWVVFGARVAFTID